MRDSTHVWLLLVDTRAGGVHTAVYNRRRDDGDSFCRGCTSENSLDLYIDISVENPPHETLYPPYNCPFIRGMVPSHPPQSRFLLANGVVFHKGGTLIRGQILDASPGAFFYDGSYMDVHHSDASCPPNGVVAEMLVHQKSNGDSETDGEEPVLAQSDANLNRVPQLLGQDLTPFEQSTSILTTTFL